MSQSIAQHHAGPWVELSGHRRFPQGFKKYLMVCLACNTIALTAQDTCMPGMLHVCALCMIPALRDAPWCASLWSMRAVP